MAGRRSLMLQRVRRQVHGRRRARLFRLSAGARARRRARGARRACPGRGGAEARHRRRCPLQVRVGIATGLVVVGDLIGAATAQEQAVVGETPNLAARLQALAEPGAVVIASSTRRLTGGLFEYRDLGAVALKGFAENVPAWQVLWLKRRREPVRGVARDRHAAGRPRRGDRPAAAPLGAGEARRRLRRADLRRARHRQIAHRSDRRGAAERRAAHPLALFLLAPSPGQRALSEHHAARTGGRLSARGYGRATARQARGGARSGDQRPQRGRPAAGGLAVDPDRRALSAARPHPAEAQGEDASGACWRRSRDWRRASRC